MAASFSTMVSGDGCDGRDSERVFGDLVRASMRDLRRFLTGRTRDREEAADISQEAYLRVLQSRDVSRLDDPRAFLFRVAANLAIDRRRSRARGPQQLPIDPDGRADGSDLASPAPLPDKILEGQQQLARVRAIIDGLPPACRDAFVLQRFHELPHAEIAERLGISKSMVEKHIANALMRIRRGLAE